MKTIIQIIALIFVTFANANARSIEIYRSGVLVKTIPNLLQQAIDSVIKGDSLVLSADSFYGYKMRVSKDLIIKGSQTSTDSTRIIGGSYRPIFYVSSPSSTSPVTKVVFRDVIIEVGELLLI